MLRIQFIIPYPQLDGVVHEVYNEHPGKDEFELMVTPLGYEAIQQNELTGNVIIARGLTALMLQEKYSPQNTILELAMSGYDILRTIHFVQKKYLINKIALIATESVFYGFENYKNELDIEIITYSVDTESDIEKLILQALASGAKVIIGGNCILDTCEKLHVPSVRIDAGKESIRQSIDEALHIYRANLTERIRVQRLNAIIDNIGEGVVSCDSKKRITVISKYFKELLGCSEDQILGKKLHLIERKLDDPPFETLHEAEIGIVATINGIHTTFSRIPIIVDGGFASGIIVVQKQSSIQALEAKIRISALKKGLIAHHSFSDILGRSKIILDAKGLAVNYAKVNANVLIIGDTGTGKELFAQSIHAASDRCNMPFVAINCAALPESLLESELFGYAPGAFTGALKNGKMGLFELAHNGTIFLDEISELSLALQAQLLRVIEEREIRRIGDDTVIPINIRCIAATNKDLRELVAQKKFRKDLFYRIDVLELAIPPLSQRLEDIPIIMEAMISKCDKKNGVIDHVFDNAVFDYLKTLQWDGNIRQIRNLCERLSVVVKTRSITIDDTQLCLGVHMIQLNRTAALDLEDSKPELDEFEKIVEALEESNGIRHLAAEKLGIERTTLYRKMKKYKLL